MSLCIFNRQRLLVTLFLILLPLNSWATSASSIRINIVPITYNNKGEILFKGFTRKNYSGAAGDEEYRYYWIVISAKNEWVEVLHAAPEKPLDKEWSESYSKEVDFYYKEFKGALNWTHPPKTLLPLINKYGFKPRPHFNKNEGQGTVTWSSKSICMNDKCSKLPIPQRTLSNKTSSEAYTEIEHTDKEIARKDNKIVWVEVPPVPCIFYHTGVALFKNGDYEIVDKKSGVSNAKQRGANFDFNRNQNAVEKIENINGEVIHSYDGDVIDEYYIDAIGIVPSELLGVVLD